jgi:hypothetical protein
MNGRIWVDSEYKRGSTFYVELPRISHEDAMQMIETLSTQAEEPAPAIEAVQSAAPIPAPQPPVVPAPVIEPPVTAVLPAAPATPTPIVAPAPQETTGPAIPTPLSSHPLQNTPLTAIEQDPRQYVQTRNIDVVVPPRNQNLK